MIIIIITTVLQIFKSYFNKEVWACIWAQQKGFNPETEGEFPQFLGDIPGLSGIPQGNRTPASTVFTCATIH